MTASALAGLIPVPGGVGAAEASLTAGLFAVGVDDSTAFAIALTYRLCTSYLPRSGVLRAAMAGTEGLRLTRSDPGSKRNAQRRTVVPSGIDATTPHQQAGDE